MNEDNVAGFGEKMQEFGRRLTIGLTLPIILVFIGLLTAPLGLFLWVLAAMLFATLFQPYGKTDTTTNTDNQTTN